MKINNIFSLLSVCLLLSFTTTAQDQGFIYGKVTTIDGRSYTGALRWDKEEVYWTDMFNASKEDNENLNYLSRDEMRKLDEHYARSNRSWGDRWGEFLNVSWHDNNDREHQHQFVCQFGEIKSIRPTGRERADLVLRNGQRIEVDGQGYNDVSTRVKVIDPEIGEIELSWSRIDMIEFMETPARLDQKFGEPLYGKVETYGGTFEGYIQWDHDERVDTDKLDGDTQDGDVSIEFGKIKSIEREGFRSMVVLNSGREMLLAGSNDVNSDNRGIIVTTDKQGRVDIPWREFKKVTFMTPKAKMQTYGDFKDQKELTASVKTRKGETLKGKVVFDLDEAYDYEVLHGKDDDIEYLIPFRYVKKVTPKNYDNSSVTLKSGEELTLGESQDVSDRNTGLLVFVDNNRPLYIMWDEIEEIAFD